ncbi:hypothetical protein [Methanolobus profundi]|uniref:N-acetyltransferase domain-containing protein n=1 Tax=Methanolobus profundi TaxID=487685 RepID=A0A1I4Q272_9EURY|nr:hypothetical protein [Methanolobus profundi]SFM33966.1 hypothetical protein SAMN04488696_1043 [Methanolobus profundi]
MFELAKTDDGVTFWKLEHAFELDKLKIGEFSYFRKYLGMADYLANFRSWLKRPSVALVLAVSDNTVVGWSMNERWSTPSTDGRPVYVLRGIEISPQLARRGMGKNMFFLISKVLLGHVITKPVNNTAKLFFESLEFEEPSFNSPVHLSDHPGYLILEEGRKKSLSYDGISLLSENIMACRRKLFPTEICLEDTMDEDDVDASAAKCDLIEEPEGTVEEVGQIFPETPADGPDDQKDEFIFDGKFIGEQKMMSPCKCGHSVVNKYQVTGKRTGTAFICNNCYSERYFLPLKKKAK